MRAPTSSAQLCTHPDAKRIGAKNTRARSETTHRKLPKVKHLARVNRPQLGKETGRMSIVRSRGSGDSNHPRIRHRRAGAHESVSHKPNIKRARTACCLPTHKGAKPSRTQRKEKDRKSTHAGAVWVCFESAAGCGQKPKIGRLRQRHYGRSFCAGRTKGQNERVRERERETNVHVDQMGSGGYTNSGRLAQKEHVESLLQSLRFTHPSSRRMP